MLFPDLTRPEAIRMWVELQFNVKHVDKVTQDLIDVATGNRQGNAFEVAALAKIFPKADRRQYCNDCRKYHLPPVWPMPCQI